MRLLKATFYRGSIFTPICGAESGPGSFQGGLGSIACERVKATSLQVSAVVFLGFPNASIARVRDSRPPEIAQVQYGLVIGPRGARARKQRFQPYYINQTPVINASAPALAHSGIRRRFGGA